MKGLLDTSVVIADDVTGLPDQVGISAATLAELHFGIHMAKDTATRSARLRRLAEIESGFVPLPIDDAVARAYGELAGLTVNQGRNARRRVMDLLIAATARAHKVPLYTRNSKDFEPLASLVEVRSV
jgi:predicted nucleic acid-binding protein